MSENQCIRVYADINQIKGCRERIAEVNHSIQELSAFLSLTANDVRLAILFLLYEEQKLCVCDLSDILNMKIPAISQHLRKMKDGGIVRNEKVGQTIFYFLNPEYSNLFNSFFNIIKNKETLVEAI